MKYSRKQLKRGARAAVAAAKPKAWLVTLIFLILCLVVSGVFNAVSPEPFSEITEPISDSVEEVLEYVEDGDLDPEELVEVFAEVLEEEFEDFGRKYDDVEEFIFSMIAAAIGAMLISALLSLISACITKILEYGYCGYCLSLYRGKAPSIKTLFCAFPRTLQVIGSYIMVAIFTALWTLLITVVAAILCIIATLLLEEVGILVSIAIVLIAMILCFFITVLRYAQTPYVVVDRRDLGVFDSISRSKELMKGNKFKLLILYLSFLGWYILVGLIVSVITAIGIVLGVLALLGGKIVAGIVIMVAFVVAAYLVSLPLNLWLAAYTGTATAGFYHMLAEAKPISTDPVAEVAAPVEAPVTETIVIEPVPVAASVEVPVESPVVEAPVIETPVVEEVASVDEAPTVEVADPVDAPVVEAPDAPAETEEDN